jgi:hypothetical protein
VTYTLTTADVGHTIRVVQTASNDGGSASQTAGQTAVVRAPAPTPTPTPTPTPPVAVCPIPTGALFGTRLGPIALGDTRATFQRRAAPLHPHHQPV